MKIKQIVVANEQLIVLSEKGDLWIREYDPKQKKIVWVNTGCLPGEVDTQNQEKEV